MHVYSHHSWGGVWGSMYAALEMVSTAGRHVDSEVDSVRECVFIVSQRMSCPSGIWELEIGGKSVHMQGLKRLGQGSVKQSSP